MSSVATADGRMTYRDLVRLPDDGLRHELLDGEHVVTPSPGLPHQVVHSNLFEVLSHHATRRALGRVLSAPLDVRFSSTDVLQPDLLFFTKGRLERLDMDRCATAAPDLVVEIVSPGTRRRDRGRKRAIYEREGVGEYWIVDPEAKDVTVLRRAAVGEKFAPPVVLSAAARDTLGSPLFPGLRVPLSRVFRGV